MVIPEFFTDKELACPCGCGKMPNEYAVKRLYIVRIALGIPMKITSAARCVTYNNSIGGVEDSLHVHSQAFDIVPLNVKYFDNPHMKFTLVQMAMLAGFKGIGIYNRHIHLDTRAHPTLWTGESK